MLVLPHISFFNSSLVSRLPLLRSGIVFTNLNGMPLAIIFIIRSQSTTDLDSLREGIFLAYSALLGIDSGSAKTEKKLISSASDIARFHAFRPIQY